MYMARRRRLSVTVECEKVIGHCLNIRRSTCCDVLPPDVTDDVACVVALARRWVYMCCEAALQVLRV